MPQKRHLRIPMDKTSIIAIIIPFFTIKYKCFDDIIFLNFPCFFGMLLTDVCEFGIIKETVVFHYAAPIIFKKGRMLFMNIYEVLEDIKSDRKKKIILDSDTYNEMDDQYAIAYALGCDKIDVIGLTAAPFKNGRSTSFADGMEKSYGEIFRVLDVTNKTGTCEVLRGADDSISRQPGFAPVDNPASRYIIKMAKESDEIIYVLGTGMCTNITSAILLDPSIKENICVIWLGTNARNVRDVGEFNLNQDYRAGQLLLNSGVPLVIVPCYGEDGHGTVHLNAYGHDLQGIKGDSRACVFFRETLPFEFEEESTEGGTEEWFRVIWDIGAPAVLSVPEAMDLSIIPAPVLTEERVFAYDDTRHKIIVAGVLDRAKVLADTFACIGNL